MNTPGWLAVLATLLVLLGFVLPVMTVSCSGMTGYGQAYSLLQLASEAEQALLYGVPLGILVALVFSFLPARNQRQAPPYLIAQAGGIIVSVLSLLIAILSIYNQVSQMGVFDITPQFGAFLLIAGYILALVGLVLQWLGNRRRHPLITHRCNTRRPLTHAPNSVAPTLQAPTPAQPVYEDVNAYGGPRLELRRGPTAAVRHPTHQG